MQTKNIVIAVLAIALLGAVGYLLINNKETVVVVEDTPVTEDTATPKTIDTTEPTETTPTETMRGPETIIGSSVNGTDITAYHFGAGEKEILFVTGVHGGYSPNTASLGKELVAFYTDNEAAIPENITLTIIPTLNPDGLEKSGAAGRFNVNNVDLNRNFDCEWSATGAWRDQEVSGGSAPFSEPEAAALRDYVKAHDIAAAVVWFSAEGKVYPSACEETPDRASVELAAAFATAAGYDADAEFDAYAITGDMVNWLAKNNIPAISVLLSDHQNTELAKNKKGVEAVLNTYSAK